MLVSRAQVSVARLSSGGWCVQEGMNTMSLEMRHGKFRRMTSVKRCTPRSLPVCKAGTHGPPAQAKTHPPQHRVVNLPHSGCGWGVCWRREALSLRGGVWGGQDGSVLVFPSRRRAHSNLGFVEDREGRNDVIELVGLQTVVVVKNGWVGSGH